MKRLIGFIIATAMALFFSGGLFYLALKDYVTDGYVKESQWGTALLLTVDFVTMVTSVALALLMIYLIKKFFFFSTNEDKSEGSDLFLFYYSGHANGDQLDLGNIAFSLKELHKEIMRSPFRLL